MSANTIPDDVMRVAKLVDPVSFNCSPALYGMHGPDADEGFKRTLAYAAQRIAIDKAKAIIAILNPPSAASSRAEQTGEAVPPLASSPVTFLEGA